MTRYDTEQIQEEEEKLCYTTIWTEIIHIKKKCEADKQSLVWPVMNFNEMS